jgi:hypothetical protein
MEVRFRHPVLMGQPPTLVGEMTQLRSRIPEGRGGIQLEDSTVATEAEGVHIRLPQEEIRRMGRIWKGVATPQPGRRAIRSYNSVMSVI